MWYVYILRSKRDGMLYTGYTENLEQRLREHNNGWVSSTAKRKPLVLIRSEEYSSKETASVREKFLKSGRGRKQLKILLARGER
ncbi:MAG: GIY-YIG nuclease family protein [Candidatus Sungiibacteriota bacterium]